MNSKAQRVRGADLLVVGLCGPDLDPRERRTLARLRPGGIILFARNVAEPEQLRSLVSAIREISPGALFYVDAEGGRVDRLRGIVGSAPAGARLAAEPPALARRAGRWAGEALRLFGFDVDLAPVVDLDRGQTANALDERYLGREPRAVTSRARAFLRGLHQAGIGGCLKHFPGLGAATMDTHRSGAAIELSRAELARDLLPFASLHADAGAVMASHAVYPALDPARLPATLSRAIATDLLRRTMRFRGILISDDLEMGALAPHGGIPERAVKALLAGCDVLPVCSQIEVAVETAERLDAASLRARREESGARLERYRRHLRRLRRGLPDVSLAAIQRNLAKLQEL